jgi:membrane protein required for colicin V production
MNTFDLAVAVCAVVAVVMGFRTGLLRSIATILGYLSAMPIAIAAAPQLPPGQAGPAQEVNSLLMFCAIFFVIGFVVSALLRFAVSEIVGPDVSVPDRIAGSALGALRVGLLAVMMVLVFDGVIPMDRQPPFLTGSQLRPILSSAGQVGLQSLPPDVAAYIDHLKRGRGT